MKEFREIASWGNRVVMEMNMFDDKLFVYIEINEKDEAEEVETYLMDRGYKKHKISGCLIKGMKVVTLKHWKSFKWMES